MKTIPSFVLGLVLFLGGVGVSIHPALAANTDADPLINVSANNQPLGEVLDAITAETGYQFKLNSQWETHPVSASITNLPLEQGLKRLLRSLNHTIIWEADRTITIMVYGKAEPGRGGGAISHAAPPQSISEASAPEVEETVDAGDEQAPADEAADATDRENIDRSEDAPADAPENAGQPRMGKPPAPRLSRSAGDAEVQEPPRD